MEHTSNFKHFLKNKIVIANVFSKLQTVKDLVWALSKKVVSERPSTFNMLKCPKHLWNLHESTSITFFDEFEGDWVGKHLPYWGLKW